MTEKSALRTMAEKSYGKVHGNLVRDPMLTNGGKVSIALNGGKVFGKFKRKIRSARRGDRVLVSVFERAVPTDSLYLEDQPRPD